MNEVATFLNETNAAPQDRNVFEQYAEAIKSNWITGDLLKFVKGEYITGQDEGVISEGTKLVALMDELVIGWVRWEGSKPIDLHIGRLVDGFKPPKRATLGDTDPQLWE